MRVLKHVMAPLAVPAIGLWLVLLYDSPLVRFVTAFVVLLALRLAVRVLWWIPVGIALRVGSNLVGGRRR